MANNWLARIRQVLLELNLFKNNLSNAETIHREQLATRIYLLSFIVLLLTIAFVAALNLRTITKIEHFPSQSKFERLLQQYPNTLKCPCSQVATRYDKFVTDTVEFHQVCSSKFITQAWIDLIYVQRNISLSSSTDDIRYTLSSFWQVIAGLCNLSKQAWTEATSNFYASDLFTPTTISEQLVQTKTRAALDSFVAAVQTTLTRSLLVIQRTTTGDELMSGLATNFYAYYTPSSITIWPRMYNDCSCVNLNGCPHSSIFNDSQGQLIPVPGIIVDCLVVDATLASTLECYYNHACLSLLHGQINTSVSPLLASLNKHFPSNSTVQELLKELMVDELSIRIAFDSFYSQCNPSYCSYTYSHRFDILFIITTIIGLFGGISIVLRLIAPFIVRVILRCKNRSSPNEIFIEPVNRKLLSTCLDRIRLMSNMIRQKLVSLNLFESKTPHTPPSLHRELIMTRLFILLLTISSAGFGFYIFFSVQTQVITVMRPSLDTYHNLYLEQASSLQCPCSQLSVPYERFLNVTYVLHQVCSSEFISSTWINYLALFNPANQIRSNRFIGFDIRVVVPSHFQLLNIFCSLATVTIDDAYRVFITTEFVNSDVLSPILFDLATQELIQSFIDSTSHDFAQTLNWIRIADLANQLMTGASINALININNDNSVSIVDQVFPYVTLFSETTMSALGFCSCARAGQTCTMPTVIYLNTSNCSPCQHYFIGVNSGCLPLSGFFHTKIAWLYNSTYIKQIQSTYTTGILSNATPPTIEPLNFSVQTQFGDSSFWITLINAMLLERWITNNSRFDLFYYACSPISCSYTIEQRRDVIVALLLFIAVCGTLSRAIRLFVLVLVNLVFIGLKNCRNHRFNQRE